MIIKCDYCGMSYDGYSDVNCPYCNAPRSHNFKNNDDNDFFNEEKFNNFYFFDFEEKDGFLNYKSRPTLKRYV